MPNNGSGYQNVKGVAPADLLDHVVRWMVYGLVDPRNGRVRYIGTTRQPLNLRLAQHVFEARNGKRGGRKKRAWINRLLGLDQRPIIVELDRYIGRYMQNDIEYKVGLLERRWIAHYRRKGYKLTNESAGGPGASHPQRAKDKAKRAASMKAYRAAQRRQSSSNPKASSK